MESRLQLLQVSIETINNLILFPTLISGHLEFENAYRIQMNNLELLPVFMSSLWMATLSSNNDVVCGSIGLTHALGRVLYGLGYPDKRSVGFGTTFFSIVGLLSIAAYHGFGGLKKYL